MIGAWESEEWPPSGSQHLFTSLGDMESEMEELRMLTRVTQLRRRIECSREGSWMFVSDDRGPDGTARRVTSYGRASRSFMRSVSRDMDFDPFLEPPWPDRRQETNVIVEHPGSSPVMDSGARKSGPDTVEIVEITDDEDLPPSPVVYEIPIVLTDSVSTTPIKKTSVVTLGKGNIVLIDPDESNFKVTAISKTKGEQAELDKNDRKLKKVEFCKTEVHFTPESGKFNIVETDEKPPPTQIFRKKKRLRERLRENAESNTLKNPTVEVAKGLAPDLEKSFHNGVDVAEHSRSKLEHDKITSIRVGPSNEKYSPLSNKKLGNRAEVIVPIHQTYKSDSKSPQPVCNGYTSTNKKTNGNIDNYLTNRKDLTLQLLPVKMPQLNVSDKVKTKDIHYLGNVSPKLKNLIQNSEKNQFIFRPKKPAGSDPGNRRVEKVVVEPPLPDTNELSVNSISKASIPDVVPLVENKPVLLEKKDSVKSVKSTSSSRTSETSTPAKAKTPTKTSARSSAYSNTVNSKYRTSNKVYSCSKQSVRKECSRMKENTTSGNQIHCPREKDRSNKTVVSKSIETKPTRHREDTEYATVVKKLPRPRQERAGRLETSDGSSKLQKLIKNSSPKVNSEADPSTVRMRRSREPLKSFEKVSNGWVGHCIVPVRRDTDPTTVTSRTTSKVSVTTLHHHSNKMPADRGDASNTGLKKIPVGIKVITSGAPQQHDAKVKKVVPSPPTHPPIGGRGSLVQKRQFSLSKEHLKSVSLVRETLLSRQRSLAFGKVTDASRSCSRSSPSSRTRTTTTTLKVSPGSKASSPSCGALPPRNRKKETLSRVRRDSEQSDDSVLRADEEVRAYMFNNKR